MELLVRVRWRHLPPADLRFDVESYHSVPDLLRAAADFCDVEWDRSQAVFLERTAAELPLDASILESGVVSGDTLRFELYGLDPVVAAPLAEAVSCDVTAGPEAGRSYVLAPGRHEVGRDPDNDVRIDDPTVSAHHLVIDVHDDLSTQLVPAADVVNPLTVNGVTVTDPVPVGPQRRRPVRGHRRRPARVQPLVGHRARPARPGPVPPHAVQAGGGDASGRSSRSGAIPTKPEKTRFTMLPLAMPVAMGLGMYAITKTPTMLMMIADDAGDGGRATRSTAARPARRSSTTRSPTCATRLDKRQREVAAALLAERAERIDQSPDLADLARRATLRTLDLWPRQRGDAEFLRTRLGLGTVRVARSRSSRRPPARTYLRDAVNAALAGSRSPAGVADLRQPRRARRVRTPRRAGQMCSAMCSSVLIQAATLHSPEDLVIVVLEGYDQGLGTWVKWLPHTRSATSPHRRRPHHRHRRGGGRPAPPAVVGRPDANRHRRPGRPPLAVDPRRPRRVGRRRSGARRRSCSSCARRPASRWSAAVDSDARVPRQAKATFRCVPRIRRRRVVGVVHRARSSRARSSSPSRRTPG